MGEKPQLAGQHRAAPLSANSSQPRVAVSDNARQQRSTKSGNHGFEQSLGVVEAHGSDPLMVANHGRGNPACLREMSHRFIIIHPWQHASGAPLAGVVTITSSPNN